MSKNSLSIYLSYVLRHNPQDLEIILDNKGWTNLEILTQKIKTKKNLKITIEDITEIVQKDKKGRYTIKNNKIRANQGHSIKGLNPTDGIPKAPPKFLYHGTTLEKYESNIKKEGLLAMSRHHVHMYDNYSSALERSKRLKGTPVVLQIDSESINNEGYDFYVSENNVWLSERILSKYIKILN